MPITDHIIYNMVYKFIKILGKIVYKGIILDYNCS